MKKVVSAAVLGLSFIGANFIALEASAASKEKCYGVVKAGKNDCATKTSSCVGSSKTDGQKDAFIAVPKGLCKKLVGGSLSDDAKKKTESTYDY